jgi:hypothetical protein
VEKEETNSQTTCHRLSWPQSQSVPKVIRSQAGALLSRAEDSASFADANKEPERNIPKKNIMDALKVDANCSLQPAPGIDRRRDARYRFSTPVTVYAKDGLPIPGMTIEISISGLSAILSSPIGVGDIVDLTPIMGTRVTAQVRRNVGKLYGFEFLGLASRQARKIKNECRKLPLYLPNNLGI